MSVVCETRSGKCSADNDEVRSNQMVIIVHVKMKEEKNSSKNASCETRHEHYFTVSSYSFLLVFLRVFARKRVKCVKLNLVIYLLSGRERGT